MRVGEEASERILEQSARTSKPERQESSVPNRKITIWTSPPRRLPCANTSRLRCRGSCALGERCVSRRADLTFERCFSICINRCFCRIPLARQGMQIDRHESGPRCRPAAVAPICDVSICIEVVFQIRPAESVYVCACECQRMRAIGSLVEFDRASSTTPYARNCFRQHV